MNPLQRASIFSLSVIFSFILFIIILVGLYSDTLSLGTSIVLTVVINFLLWAIGPTISDLIYRWIYKVHFFTKEEFTGQYPELAHFIGSVSQEYKFNYPKIGLINDRNPTAFTYGSTRNNARIVFTEGITHYLKPDEVKAVLAHEMGHIHHADFIVMSIAVTFVQILYELYVVLSKSKKGSKNSKKGGSLALIGLLSYVFYLISSYLLLYLSRVREYYADSFAAMVTKSPHSLTQALVKIAYGIVKAEDSQSSKRLLESTRSLGILDVKNAGFIGSMVYASTQPALIAEIMSFDKLSPWAWVLELSSTHPLTGKRIFALEEIAKGLNQPVLLDFDTAISRLNIDKSRLYQNFYLEVFIYFLPFLLPVPLFIIFGVGGAVLGFALGSLINVNYRMTEEESKPSKIIDEIRNPYASPMRGRPVVFDGKIVGRGVPGFVFSEDMMFQDSSGIIYLNYNSILGFLGNMFFAIGKVKQLLGQSAKADGWFFRGIAQSITLKKLHHAGGTITSHPKAWSIIINILLSLLGLFLISARVGRV